MMKRITLALLIAVASAVPAFAIEVPKEAQQILDKPATAYRSVTFNRLLMACGVSELSTGAVASVPKSYAKVANNVVKFNNADMVYPPKKYDAILTSYGLQLNPERLATLVYIDYAKVVNGKVAFAKTSTAYNRSEWIKILGCYTGSGMAGAAGAAAASVGDADGDGVVDPKDACPGTPRGVKVDNRGCWSHSATLLFALDSSTLTNADKPGLDEAKKVFAANPNLKVQIDGYTCDLGSDAYNQKLSVRRAQAVKDYLVNKAGISANRLNIKGYGESNPAYPNTHDYNREKNRRVEFTPMN